MFPPVRSGWRGLRRGQCETRSVRRCPTPHLSSPHSWGPCSLYCAALGLILTHLSHHVKLLIPDEQNPCLLYVFMGKYSNTRKIYLLPAFHVLILITRVQSYPPLPPRNVIHRGTGKGRLGRERGCIYSSCHFHFVPDLDLGGSLYARVVSVY